MSKTSLQALYIYLSLEEETEFNRSLYGPLTETFERLSICIVTDQRRVLQTANPSQVVSNRGKGENYLVFCSSFDLGLVAQRLKDLLSTDNFDIVVLESDPLSFALGVELQRILHSWVTLTQVTEVVGDKVFCVRSQGKRSSVFPLSPHQIQLWQRARYTKQSTVSLSQLERLEILEVQEALDHDLCYHVDTAEATFASNSNRENLSEDDVVLVVGAGVKDSEGVGVAATVCKTLDIGLGATRVVTDRGWLPYSYQVGTTGTTIAPKIYLAFGVSGAIQHLGGVEMPQYSIAINVDTAAPIFEACSYVIRASAKETLVELAKLLNDEQSFTPDSN